MEYSKENKETLEKALRENNSDIPINSVFEKVSLFWQYYKWDRREFESVLNTHKYKLKKKEGGEWFLVRV